LSCTVFMVRVSYDQKPYRRYVMETYGAKVHPSPSTVTDFGQKLLKENPKNSGSLGIAISEAIETCVKGQKTKYSLGSVANHVMMHQTVIGHEVVKQMEMIDTVPDYMIGCVGGGSNFAGFAFPMLGQKIKKKTDTEFIACEPKSVPSLTKGEYRYDFGDTAGMTPMFKMYTLGHDFMPPGIHAGGLRYHGMSPLLSHLYHEGYIEAQAFQQQAIFEAAVLFARTEGTVIAPESAHALKSAIEEAKKCTETGQEKVILFNLSGHGLLDLGAYDIYINQGLPDINHINNTGCGCKK
ncbi:MAG: TrpB-like pyridoxal phosphate-dependent enzyme, partial [Candidatus Atribacteria bacterium]|nr:TrpB-like pyridoxal phosphate-dependent enzyme [Candidatus Atribacteria bacterium]